MAEFVAFSAGAWITAAALDALANYFVSTTVEGGLEGLERWISEMRNWKSKQEQAIDEIHQELRSGVDALSTALSSISEQQEEGTAMILRKLVGMRETNLHDQQMAALLRATNALNDIREGRFERGHPRNLELLKAASKGAEKAARDTNGSLVTKLQSYRLWIIAEYMYEAATRQCREAKGSVIFIIGQIIRDPDIVRICRKYYDPRSGQDPSWKTISRCSSRAESCFDWESSTQFSLPSSRYSPAVTPVHSRATVAPVDPFETSFISRLTGLEESVLPFLVEVISSAAILAPIEQDVSCGEVIKVIGAAMKSTVGGKLELTGGKIQFGSRAPLPVILAMGKYCSANEDVRRQYPSVAAVVEEAWGQNKERLALDNFFRNTNGFEWLHREVWPATPEEDKGRDLGKRFGISTENGRVVKINLAANNLKGVLREDLADCEHLRELVLHANDLNGEVPARLQDLIRSKGVIATGLPVGTSAPPVPRPPVNPEKINGEGGDNGKKSKKTSKFLKTLRDGYQAGWST